MIPLFSRWFYLPHTQRERSRHPDYQQRSLLKPFDSSIDQVQQIGKEKEDDNHLDSAEEHRSVWNWSTKRLSIYRPTTWRDPIPAIQLKRERIFPRQWRTTNSGGHLFLFFFVQKTTNISKMEWTNSSLTNRSSAKSSNNALSTGGTFFGGKNESCQGAGIDESDERDKETLRGTFSQERGKRVPPNISRDSEFHQVWSKKERKKEIATTSKKQWTRNERKQSSRASKSTFSVGQRRILRLNRLKERRKQPGRVISNNASLNRSNHFTSRVGSFRREVQQTDVSIRESDLIESKIDRKQFSEISTFLALLFQVHLSLILQFNDTGQSAGLSIVSRISVQCISTLLAPLTREEDRLSCFPFFFFFVEIHLSSEEQSILPRVERQFGREKRDRRTWRTRKEQSLRSIFPLSLNFLLSPLGAEENAEHCWQWLVEPCGECCSWIVPSRSAHPVGGEERLLLSIAKQTERLLYSGRKRDEKLFVEIPLCIDRTLKRREREREQVSSIFVHMSMELSVMLPYFLHSTWIQWQFKARETNLFLSLSLRIWSVLLNSDKTSRVNVNERNKVHRLVDLRSMSIDVTSVRQRERKIIVNGETHRFSVHKWMKNLSLVTTIVQCDLFFFLTRLFSSDSETPFFFSLLILIRAIPNAFVKRDGERSRRVELYRC